MLPGFLSATQGQSAAPVDRVFMCYSLLDNIQSALGKAVPTGGGNATVVNSRTSAFSLDMFNVGVEKTFMDCRASVYISVPYLSATGNVTDQGLIGLGDVSIGAKFVLYRDEHSGSMFTGGLTYYMATAKVTKIPSAVSISENSSDVSQGLGPVGTIRTLNTQEVNPTFFDPYVAGLYKGERCWVNEYLGLIIPTDSGVSTFINNDITVGFQVYKSCDGGTLSHVSATLDFQALLPVNHIGTPAAGTALPASTSLSSFPSVQTGFSDWFFVTPGVLVGLGDRAAVNAGFVIPVGGPRAYQYGIQCGLTYDY
jgi:hypothetical protein